MMAETEFDIELLAERAVDLVGVERGQVIWIWASTHSLDLIEALAFRIRARGAFWTLRLVMEPLLRRIAENAPEEYLGLVPEHELRWLEDVNAIIEVRDHSGHIPDVPLPRRRKIGAEWIALIEEAARRGVRRVVMINPTPALAASYGVPLAQFRKAYARAIDIDYQVLERLQRSLHERLSGAEHISISSALGTDLSLNIRGRPVLLDEDGLPRGEVYVAPHENSAEGVAVIDRAFLRGEPVERLRLIFSKGRVVKAITQDAKGAISFDELLEASSGEKDRIAEFAIGLNPGVSEPTGDIMLDEKIYGSIHIAIGMNKRFGGTNRSNLHLDLVILNPTVYLDGDLLISNGVILIDDLEMV